MLCKHATDVTAGPRCEYFLHRLVPIRHNGIQIIGTTISRTVSITYSCSSVVRDGNRGKVIVPSPHSYLTGKSSGGYAAHVRGGPSAPGRGPPGERGSQTSEGR